MISVGRGFGGTAAASSRRHCGFTPRPAASSRAVSRRAAPLSGWRADSERVVDALLGGHRACSRGSCARRARRSRGWAGGCSVAPSTGMVSIRSSRVTSLPNPALLISARLATRSGWSASSCWAIAPPSELPTTWTGLVSPSVSRVSATPRAKHRRCDRLPVRSENPKPGTSRAMVRYDWASRSYWGAQSSRLRPIPCTSSTGGLSGSPSTRTRVRRPSTSMKVGRLMPVARSSPETARPERPC